MDYDSPLLGSSSHGVTSDGPHLHNMASPREWAEAMIGLENDFSTGPFQLNKRIEAGYTYLGQFIAHDITFFEKLLLKLPPRLDLHILYGLGPQRSGHLYQFSHNNIHEADDPFTGAKMAIWSGKDKKEHPLQDVYRLENGVPVIGDTRNDQNFIISQLHVKFLGFHNACAEIVFKHFHERLTRIQLFQKTQSLVILIYHLVIIHDYLPKLVGKLLIEELLQIHPANPTQQFKLFHFESTYPMLMEEFSEAAFRVGHCQVRNFYTLTRHRDHQNVHLFPRGHQRLDLLGGKRDLNRNIEWELFFKVPFHSDQKAQLSMKLDSKIALQLHKLPFWDARDQNLVIKDIEKSAHLTINNTQLRTRLGETITGLDRDTLPDEVKPLIAQEMKLDDLPLWLYILLEAAQNGGEYLGVVGGRIIAEQILAIIFSSHTSHITHQLKFWDEFSIVDILYPSRCDSQKITDLLIKIEQNA